MNRNNGILGWYWVCAVVGLAAMEAGRAEDASGMVTGPSSVDSRYGPFGWLDHDSSYGGDVFPEPFLNDDSDLEMNELRLNWLHTGRGSDHTDEVTLEIEKGFGPVTLEIELHHEWEKADGKTASGTGNVDLAARSPVFQYVSRDRALDTTFGVGIEVGVPTNTPFSRSTEVVPKIFNDTRWGEHLTFQTIVGYSALYGGDDDGIHTLEYGITAGYAISGKELPIPGILQLVPVVEISGEYQLNKEDAGRNSLLGMVGFRANTKAIGPVQPRLGLGYVFPVNATAREDLHWGVFTSLIFEY